MGNFRLPSLPSTAGKGTTRAVEVAFDPSAPSSLQNLRFRSGLVVTGQVVANGLSLAFANGRQALAVNSGLGYGWFMQYSMPVTTQQPLNAGALALRSGVTRFVTSMIAQGADNSSSDVGVDILVGIPSGISDLNTNNNTHLVGMSGWGLLSLPAGWSFVIKLADTGPHVWAESALLSPILQTLLSSLEWVEIEFRVYDATFALPAKMELYINGNKILTRYWTNPTGIVSALLPPLGIPSGNPAVPSPTGTGLIMQLRNHSQGPAQMIFADMVHIQGPNDSGTL